VGRYDGKASRGKRTARRKPLKKKPSKRKTKGVHTVLNLEASSYYNLVIGREGYTKERRGHNREV